MLKTICPVLFQLAESGACPDSAPAQDVFNVLQANDSTKEKR
jgi:hypothetical protein